MKVTICCKRFGPRGGAERFIAEFVRQLVDDGHRVKVIAATVTGPTPGVEAFRLHLPWTPRPLRDLALALASERALEREEADVKFSDQKCWGADVIRPGGGVQREYVKQRIKTYRPLAYRLFKRTEFALSIRERLRIYIDDRLYRPPGPSRIIANSHLVAEHIKKHYPHAAGSMCVVHNGVDHSRFNPGLQEEYRDSVRRELDIPEDALVGCFVATNWRRKGLWPLLEAMAILTQRRTTKPFYLIVVGKGPRFPAFFRARRRRIRSYLRLVGRQPSAVYYGASDLVLLPTYFDPCPQVVVEGMACGLPVVTTIHAGSHEILPPHGGYVLDDPQNTAEMADCIEAFMDLDRLQSASRAVLEAAAAYTCERQYRKIMRAIEPVAAGS